MLTNRLLLTLTMLATTTQGTSWAGSLIYSSLTTWQASTPGSTTVLDFESSSTGLYSSFSYSPYSFTPTNDWLVINSPAAAGTGSGHYLTTLGSNVINIAVSAGVYGIAFNLGSNAGASANASILATDINGIQYLTSPLATAGPAGPAIFFGLRTDVQLATIKVSFTTAIPQLDNIRYSNTALPPQGPVIPEPSPWTLVASGAVLFLVVRNPTSKSARSSTLGARRRIATGSRPPNR